MQNQQPAQGELVERAAGAGLPDLPTLTFEQFVEVFIERLKTREDIVGLSAKTLAACSRATRLGAGITTAVDYAEAFEVLREIATLTSDAESKRLEITRPIDAAKKRVMAVFGADGALLEKANTVLRSAAGAYKTAQDRREREERERKEAAARAERDRLAREADARRRAAEQEAAAKREEARRLEEAGRIREAAKLDSAASKIVEKADAAAVNLERRAETVVADPTRAAAPKQEGVADRTVWDFEITDPKKINALFLVPDAVKIRAAVKLHKQDAQAIIGEGIRVFETQDFSVRKNR